MAIHAYWALAESRIALPRCLAPLAPGGIVCSPGFSRLKPGLQTIPPGARGARQRGRAMRLSAKAQYACIAMLELAGAYPDAQLVQVRTIAEVHGISQRFLVQI